MIGLIWTREFIRYKRGAISIMVGRPRKIGRRQPNGQLARGYINPRKQVASQPHRMTVARRFREFSEAETEFGRLMLRGGITPAQKQAGDAYARLASRLRAVYDAASPNPKGVDLMHRGGSGGRVLSSEYAERIKEKSRRAFEACAEAGNRVPRIVKRHVILDEPVSDFETLGLLKSGLDKLVKFFGIDPFLSLDRRLRTRDSRT